MRFNLATDYAFRVVLHMASLPFGTVVTGQTLAEQQSIPPRFILKIMHTLRKALLVNSHRGTDGGFSLAKVPEEISLYDVILAMEGPISIHQCLEDRDSCNRLCSDPCPVHDALGALQEQLVTGLQSASFAELARRKVG